MADIKSNTIEENRIVYLNGEFNEEKVKDIVTKILTMESKDPNKDILMYIDSYGGYVHSFFAIHDIMKMSRCDIATICIGKAMSCAQMLLCSGTKGKRFVTPHSRILIHEISSGTFGKLSDMEVDLNETRAIQKMWMDMLTKYSKLSISQIKTLMRRDSYLSAGEAIEMGIADHIIKSSKDLYNRVTV